MDRINELLNRVQDLTPDELNELKQLILDQFDSLDGSDVTPDTVDQMTSLADALDSVSAELTSREEQAAELSRRRDEAVSRVKGATDNVDESADVEEEAPVEERELEDAVAASTTTPVDAVETVEPAAELTTTTIDAPIIDAVAVEPVPAEEPLELSNVTHEPILEEAAAVQASGTTEVPADEEGKEEAVVTAAAASGSELEVPADHRPHIKVEEAAVAITAGADIQGIAPGSNLPSMNAVAEAFSIRLKAMGRTSGGDGEQHTVASIATQYPDSRTLSMGSSGEGNWEKIQSVVSPQALMAAGGLCAPVEVRYDVFGLGVTDRPVKSALATFSADRGGIRYITPPVLTDLAGSTSLWTVQDDIDASTVGAPDPVKPCIRVACGAETTVLIDAIPLCLTFGNLNARAYPEMIARHNELGLVQHARFAETRLLTRIGTLSTAVTAARQLGTARDFFVQVDRAAAAYRNRHRTAPDMPLRVILPAWFLNLLRSDVVQQLPGDGQDETFALVDATINRWFAVRNINVSWTLDGESGQILGAQAPGALNAWPGTLVWYLFAEGTFLFLDGGTLDLGIVRDSTLNGTNDYKMFLETFEGVAKVGLESLRISSTIVPDGSSRGTVAPL